MPRQALDPWKGPRGTNKDTEISRCSQTDFLRDWLVYPSPCC
jgi:hypothetical protein